MSHGIPTRRSLTRSKSRASQGECPLIVSHRAAPAKLPSSEPSSAQRDERAEYVNRMFQMSRNYIMSTSNRQK